MSPKESAILCSFTRRMFVMRRIAVAVVFGPLCCGAAAGPAWGQCQANELDKLTASDAAAGDNFGGDADDVSISGNVSVIGAFRDDDACPADNNCDSGSAYVYRFDGASWIEEAKLTASDAAAGDGFGVSDSISGDVIVIGAWHDADAGPESGSAYVFVEPEDGWGSAAWPMNEDVKLTAADGEPGDIFGYSVSVSGDVAVIGALGDDDNGPASGSAYVFRYDGSNWVQEAKLVASDGAEGDWFGVRVSVSGDVAVIASYGGTGGAAYVYRFDGANWIEEAKLTPSDTPPENTFGTSVSISGDLVVVGAPHDDHAGERSGSAYAWVKPVGGWATAPWPMTEDAKLSPSDATGHQQFGWSVSVSGNVTVIGAYGDNMGRGAAYIYRYSSGAWIEEAKITPSDPGVLDDLFGTAVSVSGDMALIGAVWDDDACPNDSACNSGSAYFFRGLSDCQPNGMLDLCDLDNGTSEDCNLNGIPDECEPGGDCNNNGIQDICDIVGGGEISTFATGLVIPQDIVVSQGDYPAGFLVAGPVDNVVYHVSELGGCVEQFADGLSFPVGAEIMPDEFGCHGNRLLVVNEFGANIAVVSPTGDIEAFIGLPLTYPAGLEYVPAAVGGSAGGKTLVTGCDAFEPWGGRILLLDEQCHPTIIKDDLDPMWTPTLAPADFGDFAYHIFIGETAGPHLYALDPQTLELARFAVVPFDEHLHGLRQIAFSPPGWASSIDPGLEGERVLLISVASQMSPDGVSGKGAVMAWDQRGRLVAVLRKGTDGQDVEPRGLTFVDDELLASDTTTGQGALLRVTIEDFGLPDCNVDGVPDGCQILDCLDGETWCQDCNDNGVLDGCEEDCNNNSIPDECDIEGAGSTDCNRNYVPDECETVAGGDFDSDGHVDLGDLSAFTDCMAGPGASPEPQLSGCVDTCLQAFDFDSDDDVDLQDLTALQVAFGVPGAQ